MRVPPKLMAGQRRGARQVGKSDPIDATAAARVALREPGLPTARLAGREREIALRLDHGEDLVAERTRIQRRLRWLLHDIGTEMEIRERSLDRASTVERLAVRLPRMDQSSEVRICRELVRRCLELSRRAGELERELRARVKREAPQLLALPGCAVLSAAKLLVERFICPRRRPVAQRPRPGGVGAKEAFGRSSATWSHGSSASSPQSQTA